MRFRYIRKDLFEEYSKDLRFLREARLDRVRQKFRESKLSNDFIKVHFTRFIGIPHCDPECENYRNLFSLFFRQNFRESNVFTEELISRNIFGES